MNSFKHVQLSPWSCDMFEQNLLLTRQSYQGSADVLPQLGCSLATKRPANCPRNQFVSIDPSGPSASGRTPLVGWSNLLAASSRRKRATVI